MIVLLTMTRKFPGGDAFPELDDLVIKLLSSSQTKLLART